MERYDYYGNVTSAVLAYINDNIDLDEWRGRRDELEEQLNDDLWIEDSVTGNASGSYYCNAWKAEEAIAHNLDLLAQALRKFGDDRVDVLEKGAEWCDVTIRCYVLGKCIGNALRLIEDELEPIDDGEEG